MEQSEALEYFPKRVHVGTAEPDKLKMLVCAPPKWGKTTFATGCPNVLLIAFEEGHRFAECHKVVINNWVVPYKDQAPKIDNDGIIYCSAMEIIEALEAAGDECPYRAIIMDTVDMAVKMSTVHELAKAKLAYPSDGGDYGKGWSLLQTTPFRRYYNRFVKLGLGIICTTHIKEEWKADKNGIIQYRRESTLPGKVQEFLHTQSDVIINGSFGGRKRPRKGMQYRDRIVSFDGTDEIMAGTRITRVYLPNKYIMAAPSHGNYDAPWKQWVNFFADSPRAGEAAQEEYNQIFGLNDETLSEAAKEAKEKQKQQK